MSVNIKLKMIRIMTNASLALGAGTGACIVECLSYLVTAGIGEKLYFIGHRLRLASDTQKARGTESDSD